MSHKPNKADGFTLVELMLAMAFLAFILVFMLTSLTQILATYNKGLTLKSINQSGRSIAGEVQRSIRAANVDAVNLNKVAAGRLCTSSYSYVWSSDNNAVNPAVPTNTFDNHFSDPGRTLINFARIYDPSGAICTTPGDVNDSTYRSNATELISNRLQVRSLQVVASATPNAGMFIIRFVVTSDDPTGITSIVANQGSLSDSDYVCQASNPLDDQFCAANLFVTYAYAKN